MKHDYFILDNIICEFSHTLTAPCQNINFIQTGEQIVRCTVHFDHELKRIQLRAEWNTAPQLLFCFFLLITIFRSRRKLFTGKKAGESIGEKFQGWGKEENCTVIFLCRN